MMESPHKSSQTTITAVVLTCNRADRCADSIAHNAASLKQFNASILLINNGSTPISPPQTNGNASCQVINCGTNLGIAARNLVFSQDQSEFLLMLDDDAYITPSHVEEMVKTFKSDPSIAAVSFRIRNSREDESCLLPTVFHGCACGFRSSALKEIGGYPADFLYYGEEYCVALRLYGKGYRIVRLDGTEHVFHARDNLGRNKDRIIRCLVRNNIRTWAAFFPSSEILTASIDTLQRYALVARKENAVRGFIMGCTEIPLALLRGLYNRTPLPLDTFENIIMMNQVTNICRSLKARGIHQVVLCSTGKFPSAWLAQFRKNGVSVKAFWDTNSCWSGRRIRGIPVIAAERAEDWKNLQPELNHMQVAWIVGTGSLAENDFWSKTLESMGLRLSSAENSPGPGTFDLLNDCTFSAYLR